MNVFGRGALRLLIELGYWTAFVLLLPCYVVRFVLLLPVYGVVAILATLEWLQMRLTIAKINLICRDDEQTRRALLALLADQYGGDDDDEPEPEPGRKRADAARRRRERLKRQRARDKDDG